MNFDTLINYCDYFTQGPKWLFVHFFLHISKINGKCFLKRDKQKECNVASHGVRSRVAWGQCLWKREYENGWGVEEGGGRVV